MRHPIAFEENRLALLDNVDPDGLLEFSVVYTDRSLNHMSAKFQAVMQSLFADLTAVYKAEELVIVPGGGTYAMEAVARQFATDEKVLVIRNGWFSYRWSQIFAAGRIPQAETVLQARQIEPTTAAPFEPPPIDEVVAAIRSERPSVVFAPHVETSAGLMLSESYLSSLTQAAHGVGALVVLDCIASGTAWIDMRATDIDVLISAPQKGWSASPCSGLVLLGARAIERMSTTSGTSFAVNLGTWRDIMTAYQHGGHAYHATMPTDALTQFAQTIQEMKSTGFEQLRVSQYELGTRVRALLVDHGYPSVAARGFEAPGVVVSFTDNPAISSGQAFAAQGLQIAAGVALAVDEREDFQTFRIGLFGVDKLRNVDRTVAQLQKALDSLS